MSTGTGDFKDLLYASRDGDINTVWHWLQTDVDVNFLHPEFWFAPLHESIRYGHFEVSRLLLEHGANPHLQEGYSDLTPLKIAQENGDAATIALLKEYGVEVDESLRGRLSQGIADFLFSWVKF